MLTNKTKQIISCLLCAGLLLTVTGCGEPVPTTGTVAPTQSSTTASTTTLPTTLPQQTEPATTAPVATEPEITADLLVGSWYYDVYWGDCMELKNYTFRQDGTFECYAQLLTPLDWKSELYTYGTYWSWRPWPSYEGTYCVEDGVLITTYKAWDYEIDDVVVVNRAYNLAKADGVLSMTDEETGETEAFVPGMYPPRDAVAPDVRLSPLSGTWESIYGSQNALFTNRIHFYSNGTFMMSNHDYFYMFNTETGQWGWESGGRGYYTDCGTYTFDGTTLVLTFLYNDYIVYEDYAETYTVSTLDETQLVIDDQWGTYINPEAVPCDSLEALCNAIGIEYAPIEDEDA